MALVIDGPTKTGAAAAKLVGRLVWLASHPEDGVVSIEDDSVVADLPQFGLGKRRGTFARAFLLLPSGRFRSFVDGCFGRPNRWCGEGRAPLRQPSRATRDGW